MTARSTRNKMRWQAEMIMKGLDGCQEHLKLLDTLGGGKSAYIERYMNDFVTSLEMMKQVIKTFREGL